MRNTVNINVWKSLTLLFTIFFSSLMVGCSKDDEDNVVDGTEKEVVDLVGTLVQEGNKIMFVPDERFFNPFIFGACDGSKITVKNFKGSIDDYKDGCLIQGKYRNTKNVSFGDGIGGMHYYELTISQIEKYVLPEEETRSEDDILPCVILEDKSV